MDDDTRQSNGYYKKEIIMAVRTNDEIMQLLRERIGEDTSDEAISLLSDVSDTLTSYADNSNINWKEKYEQNDADWRKKYKERFFTPSKTDSIDQEDEEDEKPVRLTYEALFKTN